MPVGADALVAQRHALVHAKAMLFIDNDERQLPECHAFLEQRMGSDNERRAAVRERLAASARLLAATQPGRLDAERPEPGREVAPVLLGEDFGRRHDGGLHSTGDGLQASDRRHDGFA